MVANGLYEVLIIRHGARTTVKSDVYLNYALYGVPDEPLEMDYFFWVVRNAERTIVVDTGFSAAGALARSREIVVSPPDAFRALGITPESAPTVVVSHAHYDHIGNLDAFPHSEIVISTAEYRFWTGPLAERAQFHHSIEEAELVELRRAHEDGRVRQVDGRTSLAPGVELIELGGHTPGQLVVLVQTGDGPVLLASDAVHFMEELERDRPFTYVADLVRMYEGFDRIHDMVASGEAAHVVPGHDAGTLDRFPPMSGEFTALGAVIGRLEGSDA